MNPQNIFFINCVNRLLQGALEYGDKSFYNKSASLVNDIDEELLDVANWCAILATTCEDVEALAILQDLVKLSADMSQKLQAAADRGVFSERCFREGVDADGMVNLAYCFLGKSLQNKS